MRMRDRLGLLGVPLLLAACAGSGPRSDEGWTLVQPFHYPLAGVGGGAISGSVEVPEQREAALASRALLMALQDLQFSLLQPALQLDGLIPSNTPWATDIAPLSTATVDEHNRLRAPLALRGAQFGVAYKGLHDVRDRALRFRISALLYQRGMLSGQWAPVRDEQYSGEFFVQRLRARLVEQLQAAAQARR